MGEIAECLLALCLALANAISPSVYWALNSLTNGKKKYESGEWIAWWELIIKWTESDQVSSHSFVNAPHFWWATLLIFLSWAFPEERLLPLMIDYVWWVCMVGPKILRDLNIAQISQLEPFSNFGMSPKMCTEINDRIKRLGFHELGHVSHKSGM